MATHDASNLTARLKSFAFEAPLNEEEKAFAKTVRVRTWALTVCGCVHAAFYCRLLTAIRCKVLNEACFTHSWIAKFQVFKSKGGALSVGVLGCGHLGKQLVVSLLEVAELSPVNITVSTRSPEKLSNLKYLGVQCFYDNQRLAASVDVMFLCCLPSHLITVSSQIRGYISETCIVYSLVTAVPVPRLKQLLAHNTIVRPQYSFAGGSWAKLWNIHRNATGVLLNQEIIEVTSPFKDAYSSCVSRKWFEEVMYSALNVCYLLKVPHRGSLNILNDLLLGSSHGMEAMGKPSFFVCESFVNTSCADSLSDNSPFPWFDLSAVSLKDTPLTKFLSLHSRLQYHLSFIYRASMLKKTKVTAVADDSCEE
ncbi:NADP-dependent oxidoreductase domain-containing protein 1 [Heptranchias perlo]|uniref:NADP-dependent oxidoreductase domain-containing protein 1 n=1 Tax=Heptranchias perlo TaxID=212740 RepID=UPI00355A132E